MKKIVVIGGGHGQATILRGIKKIEDVKISAIVTVADNGGSTGRIRDLYDIPAMGDIRNVMVALSESENFMNTLMDYRFSDEQNEQKDVMGHNLGNLILTALTQASGSFMEAIMTISNVLNVKGKIIPSTLDVVTLFARMDDDTIVKGEDSIPSFNHRIKDIFYEKDPVATKEAIKAIMEADLIIYGIGSVYTSIIPNIIIPEIKEALHQTKAMSVYFANCMTQNNETFNYDLKDHVDALEKHGAKIDLIVKHNEPIPFHIQKRYLDENSIEVLDKGNLKQEVLERSILDFSKNLVRHDSDKIMQVTKELLERLG